VSFRIPTPTFGLGLVEATLDSVLQSNLAANASRKAALGIGGTLNTSGNDGTVTRFGWKAQNKSLVMFAGEAYNVEQGVSNEVFPNERSAVPGCIFNGSSEDATNLLTSNGSSTGTANEMSSDVVNFAMSIRLSAPPVPASFTRLRSVPCTYSDDGTVEVRGNVERELSSLFRFRPASHGCRFGGRNCSRRRRFRPVPHSTVVERWPTAVLHA
jgi:Di-haem oxidoreductase, putative peroxidase